ncbi:MAG: DegQ family serine endoprotease [Methylococcales bacterium]
MCFRKGISLYVFLLFFIAGSSFAALPDFTGLVEGSGAAVVNVSTTKKETAQGQSGNLPKGIEIPEGAPLDEFFRHFFGEPGRQPMPPRETKSLGSGFIISKDGYVLTNHHVVKDADEIIIRLQDRRQLEAELVGSDERSDIALLKVEAIDLPVVKLGSADALKVGEWVVAIGSPFGFDHTVTAGIVSAKGRSLPRDNYVPFIQTDVAINPGNSGGPLFNMEGEVVGINSQIYSRTGGFMGLSFAIPTEVAINVVEQIKKDGHVSRGWLGVQVQDVTRELAESFGMKRPRGALIAKVIPKSPAEKAGFKVGDILVEYDGKKIDTSAMLPPMVGMTVPEVGTEVTIIRQGRQKILVVRIGLLDENVEAQLARNHTGTVNVKRLGVEVKELTIEQREQSRVLKHGVLVQEVKPGPASDAGIQPGDVILRVGNEDIDDTKILTNVIDELPKGKSIAVLVQRRGNPVFMAIKFND